MNQYEKLKAENAELRERLAHASEAPMLNAFSDDVGRSYLLCLRTAVPWSQWPPLLKECIQQAGRGRTTLQRSWMRGIDTSK